MNDEQQSNCLKHVVAVKFMSKSPLLPWQNILNCMSNTDSLWPGDATWWHESGSTLAQVNICCFTAPSHRRNQLCLIISDVLWHLHERNFIGKEWFSQWAPMTQMCFVNWIIIRHQAITWTRDVYSLSFKTLGRNLRGFWKRTPTIFFLKKCIWKCRVQQCWPFRDSPCHYARRRIADEGQDTCFYTFVSVFFFR